MIVAVGVTSAVSAAMAVAAVVAAAVTEKTTCLPRQSLTYAPKEVDKPTLPWSAGM